MQETRNNCFVSKISSTSLHQVNTGKHECRTIIATAPVLNCFHLMKYRATYFQTETIVASFLHLMVLLFKVLLNHASKRQFLSLHCYIFKATDILNQSPNTNYCRKKLLSVFCSLFKKFYQ